MEKTRIPELNKKKILETFLGCTTFSKIGGEGNGDDFIACLFFAYVDNNLDNMSKVHLKVSRVYFCSEEVTHILAFFLKIEANSLTCSFLNFNEFIQIESALNFWSDKIQPK